MFIDYRNVYQQARSTFHGNRIKNSKGSLGQISPTRLGNLLCTRHTPFRPSTDVILNDVRVYRGMPSPNNRRTFEAWERQRNSWNRDGVSLVTRPVGGSRTEPREKGIDVELALDFFAGAIDKSFDIGILFSMDRDLTPAVEKASARNPNLTIETVTWSNRSPGRAFSLVDQELRRQRRIWNHVLEFGDYDSVRDTTNYTLTKGSRNR